MDFDEVEVGIWFAVPQISSVHVRGNTIFLLISFSSSAEFFPPQMEVIFLKKTAHGTAW